MSYHKEKLQQIISPTLYLGRENKSQTYYVIMEGTNKLTKTLIEDFRGEA